MTSGADVNLAVVANIVGGKVLRSPLSDAKTDEVRDYLLAYGAKVNFPEHLYIETLL